MTNQQLIFSPGKLLLSGEYAVLDGALALAVPTRAGQTLIHRKVDDGNCRIYWETRRENQDWLRCEIDYREWRIISTDLQPAANFILSVLRHLSGLVPAFFSSQADYYLQAHVEFQADYGLGSSSTLMANLAKWTGADPYGLNELCLGGSGYDVAVAMEQSALLYRNGRQREIQPLDFRPPFMDELLLLHLNRKQDSRDGITHYRSMQKSGTLIGEISDITAALVSCDDSEKFSALMLRHEDILSSFLKMPTVKEKYFADAPVFFKSLGAWGGDFVLTQKFRDWKNYFQERGFASVFGYDDIVCT
ncbi:MAG: 30S ribosomal protein S6 [Chryseobacterium sp.]|nr:MAG: 30S ribosomal protein S6 [Chryseobacterium sp.]